MKRFVLGDIHGEIDYLKEVIEKSGIDPENDLLIQIGDIVDRGEEPFKCIDELLKFRHLILIRGNHDEAFIQKIATGISDLGDHPENGQNITLEKWDQLTKDQKKHYYSTLLLKQIPYHITQDNICFVHGGFDRMEKIEDQDETSLLWDREFVNQMMSCSKDQKLQTVDDFKEIYIGHTPTIYWNEVKPIMKGGVINIDTGSGKGGPLTIMNIDTKEYWQSKHKFHPYVIIEKDQKD